MGIEDDDLSDLERRMREKLKVEDGASRPPALSPEEQRIARKLIGEGRQNAHSFSDEEQRMAERLVGIDNAKRITSAKEGRRVRVAPVRITYEWYWFKAGGSFYGEFESWRINRLENGRRFEHREGSRPSDLEAELKKLRDSGIAVVDANLPSERPRSKTPTISRRKAILNELRFIRR